MQNGTYDPNIEWVTIKVPIFKGQLQGYEADRINTVRLDAGSQRDAFSRVYEAFIRLFPPSPVDTNQSRRPQAVKWLFHQIGEAMEAMEKSGSPKAGKK